MLISRLGWAGNKCIHRVGAVCPESSEPNGFAGYLGFHRRNGKKSICRALFLQGPTRLPNYLPIEAPIYNRLLTLTGAEFGAEIPFVLMDRNPAIIRICVMHKTKSIPPLFQERNPSKH